MIQEFVNGIYKYTLSGPALVLSKVKINGVDLSKYLSNNSMVGEYDVSKNSGRDVTNADGTMILNVVSTKYRLDLATRPLTEDEVVDFYREIRRAPKMTVEFLNPFDKTWTTIRCYRGDRTAQSMMPVPVIENNEATLKEIFNPVNVAVIEL